MGRWDHRHVRLDSVLDGGEGFALTLWRRIETVRLVHREGAWQLLGTDSRQLAMKRWPYKGQALDDIVDHYAERGR